jgi:hypothetical protein
VLTQIRAGALVGASDVMLGFRARVDEFYELPEAFLRALVGLTYAGLCVCTTLIFLDRRENTFCVPMHCGSSMLAGVYRHCDLLTCLIKVHRLRQSSERCFHSDRARLSLTAEPLQSFACEDQTGHRIWPRAFASTTTAVVSLCV